MRSLGAAVLLCMGACLATGCASGQPIEQWQRGVTQYIQHCGNGDPNVLREAAQLRSPRDLRLARVTFGVNNVGGGPPFSPARDAQGVLVGHPQVDGRRWYVFLVGIVAREATLDASSHGVKDIRLVCLDAERGSYRWRVSPPDEVSLDRYRAAAVAGPPTFPGEADVFRLSVSGGEVSVREERSGARWTLAVRRKPAESPSVTAR